MSLMGRKLVAIVGPTASGKTDLGIYLAKKFKGEIISADSRQVYKGLDIGTGKDKSYPQHLIDIVEPGKKMYNLARFLKDTKKILEDIWPRGKLPILVGGTGLYLSGLLRGYELPPKKLGRGVWYKKKTPEFESLIIGIDIPRKVLYQWIDERLERRVKEGLVEEVKGLIQEGISPKWLKKLGLEYRFVTNYLGGKMSKKEMQEKLKYAIHGFARRQLTWLRHQLPGIHWVGSKEGAEKLVKRFLSYPQNSDE